MHRGASVAHHEYKFGVREEFQNIRAHLEGERILIAQPRRGLGVSRYYLQAEGRYRAVYHLEKMDTFRYLKVSNHGGDQRFSLPFSALACFRRRQMRTIEQRKSSCTGTESFPGVLPRARAKSITFDKRRKTPENFLRRIF